MLWDRDKSLLLSRICVIVFMVLLAALDLGGWWLAGRAALLSRSLRQLASPVLWLLLTLYSASIPGWILLWKLLCLLGNLRRGEVFTESSIRCLRLSCWCCTAAFAIFAVSTAYYFVFGFFAAAAGFMALIIHIIKNVFEQALRMKAELDLTI